MSWPVPVTPSKNCSVPVNKVSTVAAAARLELPVELLAPAGSFLLQIADLSDIANPGAWTTGTPNPQDLLDAIAGIDLSQDLAPFTDGWDGILQYQLDSRTKPCNLVELMPRLKEHLG